MRRQQGFTLIELVVVIIILGVLAITAASKFINLQSDARASTVQAVSGSMKTVNNMVHAKAVIQGDEKELFGKVVDGINLRYGYVRPQIDDVKAAVQLSDSEWGVYEDLNSGVSIYPIGTANVNGAGYVNTSSGSHCAVHYHFKSGELKPTYEVLTEGC